MPDEQMPAASAEPKMDAEFSETGAAEVFDEDGARRRELEQNLADDEPAGEKDKPEGKPASAEAQADAAKSPETESFGPAGGRITMRDMVAQARQHHGKSAGAPAISGTAAMVSAPTAVVTSARPATVASQAAPAPGGEKKEPAYADVLDMASSIGSDAAERGVASAKGKAGRGLGKSVAAGARVANNSIDPSYLSGSVSAIGTPCMLPGGQQAIIMIGTPVVCMNGAYAVMGTKGVQQMSLAGADGANNGDTMRNAFMLGFMSGMQGQGFMNGFMRSMGAQLGMAGLSALQGRDGMRMQSQHGVSLETGELSDLATPSEDKARSNVDLNGDGIANDEQQHANMEANADTPMGEGGAADERGEEHAPEAPERPASERRLPNPSLMGRADGSSMGLGMGE